MTRSKHIEGGGSGTIDLITGGFPCQPFSTAGKRRGTEDDRHLWPEMFRIIREVHPRWIVGENVVGLLTWNKGMVLEGVLADLGSAGYEAWPFVIPACGQNAPHRRDRVWIIAHSRSGDAGRTTGTDEGTSSKKGIRQWDAMEQSSKSDPLRIPADSCGIGRKTSGAKRKGVRKETVSGAEASGRGQGFTNGNRDEWNNWPQAVSRLCVVDDGISGKLVRPRGWRNASLKAAGNAIVPQVAAEIMRAIKSTNTI